MHQDFEVPLGMLKFRDGDSSFHPEIFTFPSEISGFRAEIFRLPSENFGFPSEISDFPGEMSRFPVGLFGFGSDIFTVHFIVSGFSDCNFHSETQSFEKKMCQWSEAGKKRSEGG
jgi:hypothetical protein